LAGKHGPNGLRSYLEIHETVLRRFVREGFVDGHDIVDSSNPDDPAVQTVAYAYNVHRHAFDWQTGEVLEEMREWYWLHRDELT